MIVNTGEGSTLRDFSVRFEVDGVAIGSRLVTGGLSTGEQVSVSRVWTSEGGIHTATVVVDEADAVTESDEQNNQLIEQLPEVVAPDLIVFEVTWSPAAQFSDGEEIPVFATLLNTGSGATLRDFSVRFEVDGVFIGSYLVTGGLTAGQFKVASQLWTSQVGIHILTATVDETNAVEGTDENNNTLSATMPNVPATDLVVISIAWVPAPGINAGEEVTFTATVKNISENSTTRDFNVRFEIDNAFIGQARITGDMTAGQERQATQTWTSRVGIHEVKAIADSGQEVTESTEDNNEKIETLPEVVVPGFFVVTGQVTLQGRTNHAGVLVTFADTATGGVHEVTTDEAGSFSVDLPPGNYDVEASHSGYLPARQVGLVVGIDQPNALPLVTLAGGDADGDGDVDFRDLRIIGNHFNTIDTDSDINGDGSVDVLDLAIAASNFGRSESPWPADS